MPKLGAADLLTGDLSERVRIATIALGTADEQEVAHHNGGVNRRVTKVTFIPDAAATGNDTNNFKLAIVNKGLAGAGTTEVAGKLFDTGEDLVEADGEDITLSTTLANLIWKAGEVLAAAKTETGSGLAMPAGVVEITYQNVGLATV